MNLLIVTDYFYPHWTGISQSVYHLTQALKNEFSFTVVTTQHRSNLALQEKHQGITIIRKPPLFQFSRLKYAPTIISQAFRLITQTDLVFINSPCSHILPVALLARLFNKKVFIFHQGDLILPPGLINYVVERIYDLNSFLGILLAHRVATYTKDYARHSRTLRPFLHKFTPMLIPIPTNTTPEKPLPVFTELTNKYTVLIGFAGRFVAEKGFDILLHAIPRVVKVYPQAHFIFAGETNIPYESYYQSLQNDIKSVNAHLTFLGLLDPHQLAWFYRLCDLIVVPSRSDCFNLVQAEAMLQGTPVVIADIPGARMLVKRTQFGHIFESKNPFDLAEKIITTIKHHSKLLQYANAAKNYLDYQKNAKKALKILQQV